MKRLSTRIEKLEAAIAIGLKQKKEMTHERALELAHMLGKKTISDLCLFVEEMEWHKKTGDKEGEAEVLDRIKKYCEGKEVRIIDEGSVTPGYDVPLDELSFTTTQNPNAPSFEELNEKFLIPGGQPEED